MPTPEQARAELRRRAALAELERRKAPVSPPVDPAALEAAKGLSGLPPEPAGKDVRIPVEPKPKSVLGKLRQAYSRGGESVAVDFLWHKVAMGQLDETTARQAQDEFESLQKYNPIEARNWLEGLFIETAQIAAPMVGGLKAGAGPGVAAAGIAAAAGQAGPQVAIPEEVVTVPGAFAGGVAVGSTKYWAEQGSGLVYRTAREAGVPHETAAIAASLTGPLYAWIERSQVDKLIPGFKKVKGGLFKKALDAAVRLGQETSEEGLQRLTTDTAVTLSRLVEDQISVADLPVEMKQSLANSLEEMKQAVGPLTLLGVPAAAVGVATKTKMTPVQGVPIQAAPAPVTPTQAPFTAAEEGVSAIPEVEQEIRAPEDLEFQQTIEAERRTRQLTEAHGRNRAAMEGEMADLIQQAEETKNVNKMARLADQMEKLDAEIEKVSEENIGKAGMKKLHRIAKRQGIELPEGATRETARELLRGPQDVVPVRGGFVIRFPIAEKGAWSLSKVFPSRQEAEDALVWQRAKEAIEPAQPTILAQPEQVVGEAPGVQPVAVQEEPEVGDKLRTDRALLYLGHEIPKKLDMSKTERKALMIEVTGEDSMAKMTPKQREVFVSEVERRAKAADIEYDEYKITPKDEVIDQLRTRKRTRLTEGERRRATKFKWVLNWAAEKWTAYNLNLDLILKLTEMLDGYAEAGPLKTRIYHPMKNAIVAARDRARRTITSMYKGWEERGINYAAMATNTRNDVVPDFPITDLERINIYMLAQNEKGRRRAEAWFEDEAIDNAEAVDRVIESVKSNPKELEIADTVFSYLKSKEPAFFAAAERMGVEDIKREENYLMLFTEDIDEVNLPPVVNELMRDFPQPAKTPGERATKKRTGTRARAKINLAATLPEMIRNIERFIEVGPVAKDVSKIVDSPTVKELLNDATRGQGYKVLRNWLNHSVRGQLDPERGAVARTAKYLRRNSVLYLLGDKIVTVVPKQAISATNVMAKHPSLAPAIMGRMVRYGDFGSLGNLKEDYELAASKSIMMRNYNWHRDLSRLSTTKDAIKAFKGKRLSPISMAATAYFDRATRTAVWLSAYDKAIVDLNGNEKAAVQFADDTVTESQPMGDIEDLAPFFRGGVLEKLLTTFMNQPQKNWSFLRHDIYGQLKEGKISPMRATQRFIMGQIMPAIMLGIISRGRLPDDPEEVLEDIAFYMLSPHVFLGRWVYNTATGNWGPEEATGISIPLQGFTEIGRAFQSVKRGEVQKTAEHTVKAVGAFTGKVSQQIITTTGGVIDLLQGETDDYKRLIYSEGGIKYRESEKESGTRRPPKKKLPKGRPPQ